MFSGPPELGLAIVEHLHGSPIVLPASQQDLQRKTRRLTTIRLDGKMRILQAEDTGLKVGDDGWNGVWLLSGVQGFYIGSTHKRSNEARSDTGVERRSVGKIGRSCHQNGFDKSSSCNGREGVRGFG
jgi:hypothetical protein